MAHPGKNLAGPQVRLFGDAAARLDALIKRHVVAGDRYPAAVQAQIDTEEFA